MPASVERSVVTLDPALDEIVSPNATVDVLRNGYFGFTEGPVWIQEGAGYLLFSDIAANVIYRWTPDNALSVFLAKSGYTGMAPAALRGYVQFNGRVYVSNIGSNGITVDKQGRLVFCAHGDRSIVRLEKDGARTTLADRYHGKRFNRPNDIVIKSNGAVYFTDPRPNTPDMELPTSAVFLVQDGTVQLLDNDIRPNGLAFSPDEKFLYLVNTGSKIMRYDVLPDGTIANGRLFVDLGMDKTPGGADGLKVDQRGNLYSTGPGGVWIVSPDGRHLGTIRLPETATNIAFGDADARTLYITARTSLARIRLRTPGIRP